MIKKLVVIFFLFLPLACFAKWTEVARTIRNPPDIYLIDFGTAIKKDGLLRLWTLTNFGAPLVDNTINSAKSFEEIDCAESKKRTLQSTGYSEFDGNGKSVLSINSPEWKFVVPGSVFEDVLKAACAFKK